MDGQLQWHSADWRRRFRSAVRRWYRRHARDLPWRDSPSLYTVWVSEIMLQQTQVETVKPYFSRFVKKFPDVKSLANADEQDVLKLWEGLGYYRRARQMCAASRVIVDQHDGVFPEDAAAVLALPGIGRYTMGAILSIALNQRQPILEANTIRLFSRLNGYCGDPASRDGQRRLWEFAEQILPQKHVAQFNQALMDLGSLVCQVRDPHCMSCPLTTCCVAFARGLQGKIPLTKKQRYEKVAEAALVVAKKGRVLLRQHTNEERWTGLWDFPRLTLPGAVVNERHRRQAARLLLEKIQSEIGIDVSAPRWLKQIKYGVTRYRITLECFAAEAVAGRKRHSEAKFSWVRFKDLDDLPTNASGRKIARLCQLVLQPKRNGRTR